VLVAGTKITGAIIDQGLKVAAAAAAAA